MPEPAAPIGRVVATELRPSTPHQFHFWTATDTSVGIGAIVRVDDPSRTVYGVVTDGMAYSDAGSALHEVIGAEGQPASADLSPTRRTEVRLFVASVLRQMPEEPLQPVPLGSVYLATDADVELAVDQLVGGSGDKALVEDSFYSHSKAPFIHS